MARPRFRRRTKFLGDVGLSVPAGENGRSALEMLWSRPTCDVNGIVGGYTGEGAKTVLPAEAQRKIFVPAGRQPEPGRASRKLSRLVKSRLPADVKAEFFGHGGSRPWPAGARRSLAPARRALEAEWGKPAAVVGSGGSIPIVGAFKRELGMDSLMVGFGLDDDAHPFAEREIRAPLVPQRRALLGANSRRPSRNEAPGVGCGAAIVRDWPTAAGQASDARRRPAIGICPAAKSISASASRTRSSGKSPRKLGVDIDADGPARLRRDVRYRRSALGVADLSRRYVGGRAANREPEKTRRWCGWPLDAPPAPLALGAQAAFAALKGRK